MSDQKMEAGAPSNASGPPEQLMHKNRLQEFTQRAALPLPMYQTVNEGHPHAPQFRSTVVVDGQTFTSSCTYVHKKAAEQDVARLALEGISTMIKHQGVPQIQEDPMFCKSILHEYAVKMNFEKPTYTTSQEEGGPLPIFVSSSVFNGETFIGNPAKTKKEAERMAARVAIESVLANSNTRTLMCEIIKSKGKLYAAVHKSSLSGLASYKDMMAFRSQMQERANMSIAKGKEPQATLANVAHGQLATVADGQLATVADGQLATVAAPQLATVAAPESFLPHFIKVEEGYTNKLNSETIGNGSEAYATHGSLPTGVVSSTNNASEESHLEQDSQVNGCINQTVASTEPGGFPTGALNARRKRSKQKQGNESKKARTDEQLLPTPPPDNTENPQQNV